MKRAWVIPFSLGLLLSVAGRVPADGNDLPGAAFEPGRYEALWDSSPFAVATTVAMESQEYFLVGVAQFDGVSYASIVDKQNQDHFVVTSTQPAHGLKLVSLTRGQDPGSSYGTFQKDGALLNLKLETAPMGAPTAGGTPAPVPVNISPVRSQVMFPSGFRRFPPRARIFAPPVYVPRPTGTSE